MNINEKKADPERVTKPSWKLLDDKWQARFSKIEHKLRAVISNASPDFPIPGVYVIPRIRARELFEEVDKITREQFYPLVQEFVDQWDEYVAAMKVATPDAAQWEQIVRALPANKVQLKFRFAVTKHIIPMAGSFDKELTGAAADDFADEIQKATREFVSNAATAIMDSLTEELRDALDNLIKRIEDRGIVKEGTLDIVERAFLKFKSFSFAAKPEIMDKIKEIEQRLEDVGAKEINNSNRSNNRDVAQGLSEALQALRKETEQDFSGLRSFGRHARSIAL